MSIKHAEFTAAGSIDNGSITNAYQTILTTTGDSEIVFVFNSTDSTMLFNFPGGGSSDNFVVPSNHSFSIDARTNNMKVKAGEFKVKYLTAPSNGIVSISTAR